jgi:hypothetical protein
MMPTPAQVWLVVEAIDMRAGIVAADTDHPGPHTERRQRLRLSQPPTESAQAPDLGRHWRLALPATFASRSLHLAQCKYGGVHTHR